MSIKTERKTKTLLERAESIFKLLEKEGKFIFKSDFEKIGIGVHSIENWIKLIQYIQNKPTLKVKKMARYTMIGLESFTNNED
ncbi:MAG: hypothetical protein ACFFDI_08790 [Promethearchaeota archaeon]